MKHFCMKLGPILAALLCLLLTGLLASCTKAGLSVTAYRGVAAEAVDLGSPRTMQVSVCCDDSINLSLGSDGIVSRYLVAVPNPWYDAACADASARGHYRFFFAEEGAMWYFNLECNCGGK